jgi:DNA-binding MarR family transcriptional regulator
MLVASTGGVASSTLAEQLGTTRSAITPLVDRLIEQKLVRRETDPADRRVTMIRPTSRAFALQQALLQTRRPVLERVWSEVPAHRREAVQKALEVLLDSAEQVIVKERQAPPSTD